MKPYQPSKGLVLLALLGLPLLLFWPAFVAGKMLWGADIQTLALPFNLAARQSLDAGEWPLWMPELLGGMPGIAGTNLVFLYPSELLLALLRIPVPAGFALDAALQVALAGLGLYGLCRSLGLSRSAALLGGVFFAASGSQVSILYAGHINNIKAIAAIPWVFWAAHHAYTRRSWGAWALCGAALALQILGIGMQIFAYTIIGLGAFVLWMALGDLTPRPPLRLGEGGTVEAGGSRRRLLLMGLAGLAVAAIFSILLSAPQLLPSLQYKPFSWREGFSYEQFVSWSFHPKEALGWIVPGFYGWREPTYHGDWPFCLSTEYFGLLPWVLAAGALATLGGGWKALGRRPEAFFFGLALFSFLAGMGKYFPLHHVFYHLPVYNGFRTWARFLVLLTFSVSVLAAYGWDALASEEFEKARKWALGFAGLALLAVLGSLLASRGVVTDAAAALVNKLGPGGPAQVLDLAQLSAVKAGVIALLLMGALAIWGKMRAHSAWLLAAALVLHGVDAGEVGRRYLEFKAPAELTAAPGFVGALPRERADGPYRVLDLPGIWQQNAAMIQGLEQVQGYHGVQMAAPMKLLKAMDKRQFDWLNLMGARYILSTQDIGIPGGRLLTPGQGVRVIENPAALPRAFVVGATRLVPDEAAAFAALGDPAWRPEREAVLLQGPPLNGAGFRGANVAWLKRTPNSLSLKVETSAPSVLLIAQTWYPGWRAEVDGVEQPVLLADGALQGLVLQAGSHQVQMRFTSPALAWGALACLAGLLALGGLLWRERAQA